METPATTAVEESLMKAFQTSPFEAVRSVSLFFKEDFTKVREGALIIICATMYPSRRELDALETVSYKEKALKFIDGIYEAAEDVFQQFMMALDIPDKLASAYLESFKIVNRVQTVESQQEIANILNTNTGKDTFSYTL